MDRTKILCCLAIALTGCSHERRITIGSKNFTEQQILGEIVAQHLEAHLKTPVVRKLGLGGTLLAHQALVNGEIDLYPEYTGTGYTNVLKHDPVSNPRLVLETLRSEYAKAYKVEWLDPLGFNNSFALAVRGEDARGRKLDTLSDAAKDPKGFALGAGYEFVSRPDGLAMLNRAYAIHWLAPAKTMDLGLLYSALTQKQVDLIAGSATDGVLSVLDAKVLNDDKQVFPPYQACLLVRSEALAAVPELRAALTALSGKISTEAMRKMNYEVDGKRRQPAEVAREFLKATLP